MAAMSSAGTVDLDSGITLWFETFGDPTDPALLLVCGLGAQALNFDVELCESFVDRGLHVIRFDNRDAGLSTHLDDDPGYTLSDMAADAIGLLDHLAIERAHVWGSSMGGMIVQTMAIEHPGRLVTMTSVQSSTGEAEVGQHSPDAVAGLLSALEPAPDRASAIDNAVSMTRVLTNNADIFDPDRIRRRHEAFYDRAHDPAGLGRQAMAVMASGDRAAGLAAIDLPTLVMHGDLDPLVDISGGRRTAELIAGARFVEVEGMGHDLTPVFWNRYIDETIRLIAASL